MLLEGSTCDTNAINKILRQPKWNQLRRVEKAPLLKGYPKVNVHNLSGTLVDEDVIQVPVAQANDVPCK